MGKKIILNKKGAASFYIVAISTLVLVIIAVSFAAVIISEINRTSNDDLAQSAYDSAMAGVEDAKLAYYKYRQCEGVNSEECVKMREYLESDKCDMVGRMLGRIQDDSESTEVKIQESSEGDNNMQQSYTCVKMNPDPGDLLYTLTDADPVQVVKVKLDDPNDYPKLTHIKVQWGVADSSVTEEPETLSVGVVQTANTFTLEQFDNIAGDKTNRGTVFLVPSSGSEAENPDQYTKVSAGGTIKNDDSGKPAGLLKSNNHAVKNVPYHVAKSDAEGALYPYSVNIELPCPVGTNNTENGCSERNSDTFIVSLARMGGSATSISLQFCTNENKCEDIDPGDESVVEEVAPKNTGVSLDMQVEVDATGRANDIYRRVSVRLGNGDSGAAGAGLLYAVQALGKGNEGGIHKITDVTCEPGFAGCE